MHESDKLESAVARGKTITSFLGPTQSSVVEKMTYSSIYSALFPLMRKHSVKGVLATGMISITGPSDSSSFTRFLLAIFVRIIASAAYNAIIDLGRGFQEEADGLYWILFRIGFTSGESDGASWRADREDQPTYAWYIAKPR